MPRDQEPDLGVLSDLCTPWCVHVAATVRVADHIAAGVSDVRALAAACGCDAGALHRVLSHLARKGVFAEVSPGRFALTDAARGLLDPTFQLSLDLTGIGGRFAGAWGTLLGYVRTGRPAYHELFGRPFWEDLEAHPELAASFDALMGPAGHGPRSADIPIIGGWDTLHTVVDVGGGTGALLAAILRAQPHMRGTLVDLPRTVARAGETFRAAGVTQRVTIDGQSFFDPLPPGADVYLLSKVLNDWPDAEAGRILRRCAEAAHPSGRVLVLGGVGPDDEPPVLSIEIVLLGGAHRSLSAFRELARAAGLEVMAAAQPPSGPFTVECHPR